LLLSKPDLKVVGEAAKCEEPLTLAGELQPEVILMDPNTPEMSGIEAICQLLHTSLHASVLVISMFEDDDSVSPCFKPDERLPAHGCSEG
jgi:DNA-binding NarL/FixJ family response regulator